MPLNGGLATKESQFYMFRKGSLIQIYLSSTKRKETIKEPVYNINLVIYPASDLDPHHMRLAR